MAYPVRALSLQEIFSTAFAILRDHFSLLFALGAIAYAPLVPLMVASRGGTAPVGNAVTALVSLLLLLTTLSILPAAITIAVGDLYLGRPTSLGDCVRAVFPKLAPLAGTILLLLTFVLIPSVLAVFVDVRVWQHFGAAAGVALGVVACAALMRLWLTFLVVWQVCLLEDIHGMAALRRSRLLTAGNLMRGLVVTLVGGLISSAVVMPLQALSVVVPLFGSTVTALAQGAAFSFSAALAVVFYVDVRCRNENFDIDHLAEQAS